ncbi:Ig-like domain-containing protein [Grimontia sp. NTOU-MAR1]|uniref:Ig-like domain-containing protein n=1 Tax=Grimontia sp. NTOU-MAR1 TaxID=3111011 RepID=UPI002DB68D6A|nr:Ig-like domain-containing protein [Grimontia sp. NTOU-MAR1]WRW00143.1 Ig-like domain-containing protein [Grimontia sp. NTOU-MAR1]
MFYKTLVYVCYSLSLSGCFLGVVLEGKEDTDEVSLTEIQLNPTSFGLAKGLEHQIKATARYSDLTTEDITDKVSWQSSDDLIVTVSQSGMVSGIDLGQAEIHATLDGMQSNKSRFTITVALLTSIQISPATVTLDVGDSMQLNALGSYSDATTSDTSSSVTWFSSDTAVATVDSSGYLTSIGAGTASISASESGISSNSVSVIVNIPFPAFGVCGHVSGQPLGTSPGGGINDTSNSNLDAVCLKVREIIDSNDLKTKWFTSTPSMAVIGHLGYTIDSTSTNMGDTYAATYTENGSRGPSGVSFALFTQWGNGVTLPPNDPAGVDSQYDRWCTKLNSENFAGQSDWRRATLSELQALYAYENIHTQGMYARYGWPTAHYYWAGTVFSHGFMRVLLYDNTANSTHPGVHNYVSCVSEP